MDKITIIDENGVIKEVSVRTMSSHQAVEIAIDLSKAEKPSWNTGEIWAWPDDPRFKTPRF